MREPRNPFRLRASESIESDATFLRLFGPGMLDLLPAENLWDKPQVFRSAPGGGQDFIIAAVHAERPPHASQFPDDSMT